MKKNSKSLVGLDIGGTKIEGILWQRGKIVATEKIRTPKTRAKFLKAVQELVKKLADGKKISGVGVGMAGILNSETGRMDDSRHLPFLNKFPLAGNLQKRLKTAVKIENDTRCYLLGESRFGVARGKQNVVGLTLGTGLGGAVIDRGRLIRGKHDWAQLSSLILAERNGRTLNFEDLVSGHGFTRLGVKDPLEYQNRAFAGDKKAIKVYDEVGKFLGIGCAVIAQVFDPEMIVIGGGISRAGRLLLDPAKKEMVKRLGKQKLPQMKISKLKYVAALGAVSLMLPKDR